MNGEQPIKTILILAANPKGTVPLRLDEEVREIKAGLQRSRHRDRFVVEYESAARPSDVQQAMLDYAPQIVHFCGHGEGAQGLVLEDESGKAKLVSTEALANLFGLFADTIECVLLNACYSEVQAQAIAQHIDAVIGMNQAIGDRAAINFAVSFYKTLGAGREVEFAFNMGCNAMQLAGIFLSAHSVHSEMVLGEIETAHRLSKEQGKPTILPIRLGYRDPFAYPISAYLNGINWAFWDGPIDTPRLLEELRQAIGAVVVGQLARVAESRLYPCASIQCCATPTTASTPL